MVREVISLGIGQCGIQLGYQTWRQYCIEHNISVTGKYDNYIKMGPTKQMSEDQSFRCFFQETQSGQFVPRNIFIDTEPNVIDDINISHYKEIFNPQYLIKGAQDAANNFARGYYSIGNCMIDTINESIRKLSNDCDNLQGFIITHSVSGGTGSGLGSLILNNLTNNYAKKCQLGFHIYPSVAMSTNIVEPYNSLLTTDHLIEHTHISLVLDNEAIYEICQRNLEIDTPSYSNINKLVSKMLSATTVGLRFDGDICCDLNEIQTNMVAFPRLHFLIESMAPVCSKKIMETHRCDILSITESCYHSENFWVKLNDFNSDEDKYMAISEQYRGDIRAKHANATVPWLKTNKKMTFVEWCPTGFKIGINNEPLKILSDDDIAFCQRHVSMIGNNTCISRVFNKRMSKKYDLMYNQRAFVHWYVSEGMEECEFEQARENLSYIEKDYNEVLCEMVSDDMDSDDDYD